MQRVRQLVGAASGYAYALELPASDYTLRVIPAHAVACVPSENAHILWQRWLGVFLGGG